MARRRLTIKRIDPWSVLKFGTLANIAMLGIFLLVMSVVWFIVDRLRLVDQICGIATDIGFARCGINAPNVFRALIMLGLLWVVVQTAVVVFLAFLHNLIADLTGGLELSVVDEAAPDPEASDRRSEAAGPAAAASRPRASSSVTPAGPSAGGRPSGGANPAGGSSGAPATPRRRPTGQMEGVVSDDPRPASRRAPSSESTGSDAPARPAPRPRPGPQGDDELFGGR